MYELTNYTSINRSKKLLGLGLCPETADMIFDGVGYELGIPKVKPCGYVKSPNTLPCWSVGALLKLIPFECNLHKFTTEDGTGYRLESFYLNHTKLYHYPIDACIEMVGWAIEHGKMDDILRKESNMTEEEKDMKEKFKVGDLVKFNCADGSSIQVRITSIEENGMVYGNSSNASHWCNIENVEP